MSQSKVTASWILCKLICNGPSGSHFEALQSISFQSPVIQPSRAAQLLQFKGCTMRAASSSAHIHHGKQAFLPVDTSNCGKVGESECREAKGTAPRQEHASCACSVSRGYENESSTKEPSRLLRSHCDTGPQPGSPI